MGRLRQRRTMLVVLSVCAVVVMLGGTWLVASHFQSTAQREAATAPPEPAPVLHTVRRGDLRDEITVSAEVVGQEPSTVKWTPSSEGTSVVTGYGPGIALGETAGAGQLLLWSNDRPLFAMTGSFPAYRDLRMGDEGRDVEQLQRALTSIGYDLAVDGEFGIRTFEALTHLYEINGTTLLKREKGVEQISSNSTFEESETGTGPKDPTREKELEYEYVLPQTELCFIAGLSTGSVRLNEIPAVGTVLDSANAQVKVSKTDIVLEAEVPGNVAAVLLEGMSASIVFDGNQIDLTVKGIEPLEDVDDPKDAAQGTRQSAKSIVTFSPRSGVLPETLNSGDSVVVAVSKTQEIAGAILVPKRAISTTPDGGSSVLKKNASGEFVPVAVKEISCVAGECAIESPDGQLNQGDQIRVDG